jgi:hypothetical protein
MIPPPEVRVQLFEGDALDAMTHDTGRLEYEVELCELGVPGKPCLRSRPHTANLLLVDHLQRMPELGAAFLLHLHDEKAAAPPQDEIELVAADARVGVEKSVTA